MNLGFWRALFLVAAAFNLGVGALMVFAPATAMALAGAPALAHPLHTPACGLMVAGFGVAYLLLARRPVRNRDIALAGAIGKLGAVALIWTLYARGIAPEPLAMSLLPDLAWAAAFLLFYQRSRGLAAA